MERILALDVGQRRIGLAVSDALGLTAQGLATRVRQGLGADLNYLRSLAVEYKSPRFVLGLPLNMNGSEGPQAARIRQFGTALARHTHLEILYWDERLTTVEAHRLLRQARAGLAESRSAVDRISAVLILHSYLESRSSRSGEPLPDWL